MESLLLKYSRLGLTEPSIKQAKACFQQKVGPHHSEGSFPLRHFLLFYDSFILCIFNSNLKLPVACLHGYDLISITDTWWDGSYD